MAVTHVCSLKPKAPWRADVFDWDRKMFSHENYFTAAGVSVDPGNCVLGTMMLLLRRCVAMEPPWQDQRRQTAQTWSSQHTIHPDCECQEHPRLTVSMPPGLGAKRGLRRLTVATLTRDAVAPVPRLLRLVLTTLCHEEEGQRLPEGEISNGVMERMGDIIEAAGGVFAPAAANVSSLMQNLYVLHDLKPVQDTEALRLLTALAVNTSELVAHFRNNYGVPSTREHVARVLDAVQPNYMAGGRGRAHGMAYEPTAHKGACWICCELRDICKHVDRGRNPKQEGLAQALQYFLSDAPPGLGPTPASDTAAQGTTPQGGAHEGLAQENSSTRPRDRTPAQIIDARFMEGDDYSARRCDNCLRTVYGQDSGGFCRAALQFLDQGTRTGLWTSWDAGEVDATWYCLECWRQAEMAERNGYVSRERARQLLRLPPQTYPPRISDNRLTPYKSDSRYAFCDWCKALCVMTSRWYNPGSFVYTYPDNEHAGPNNPKPRKDCFPPAAERQQLWQQGVWNATYACRICLLTDWRADRPDIARWLAMREPDPRFAKGGNRAWHGWRGSRKEAHDQRGDYHSFRGGGERWP